MSEKRFVDHDTSVENYVENLESKNLKQKTKRDVKLLETYARTFHEVFFIYIQIHMNNDFIIHVHDRNYLFFSRFYALHSSVSKLRAKSFFS